MSAATLQTTLEPEPEPELEPRVERPLQPRGPLDTARLAAGHHYARPSARSVLAERPRPLPPSLQHVGS